MDIIIGVTGASGSIYAIRFLEFLKEAPNIKTHLVISKWAGKTLKIETSYSKEYLYGLADYHYDYFNQAACISSGSFKTSGMVIIPCSMKTLAAIAYGYAENLISRAADVCLKEHRKLILVARETPLSVIHLENMTKITRAGGTILPPVPAFYNNPSTVNDIVNHTVGRILDLLGVNNALYKVWGGNNPI